MKDYELIALIHPDLESDLNKPLTKLHDLVLSVGGTIVSEDIWGKKKLAYKIKKLDFAVYVYMKLQLPANSPTKISNSLNIYDEVIRYLLVKPEIIKQDILKQDSEIKQEKGAKLSNG